MSAAGPKRLHVIADRCTGCRLCEAVCAVRHLGVTNPEKARLQVQVSEDDNTFTPVVCRQCKKPRCIEACPGQALSRDENTRIMHLEESACDGCGKCIEACPFRALRPDPGTGLPLACDLCGGDPCCAEFCDAGAIVFAAARPGKSR